MRFSLSKFAICLIVAFTIHTGVCHAVESSAWGINTHTPTTAELDICTELGVGWIRVDFNWVNMEPYGKGQYNWAQHDTIVAEAAARNLSIFGTISYTPVWASTTGQYNGPPKSSSDWSDFVSACVTRYSNSVRHWGMWNEPNLTQFWTGSMADYVNLILIPGYNAAKSANSQCLVLGPELSDQNRLNTLDFLDYILKNASQYIDILTQHSYGSSSDVIAFIGSSLYPQIESQLPDIELWLTETGWRTDMEGDEYQASMYQAMCEAIDAAEPIKKVFFYHLADDAGIEKWGIITYPGKTRKLAFTSYQSYIAGTEGPELPANCFIATAAYGTPLVSEVRALSEFRDRHLLRNVVGRQFVRCYYKISPPIARIISKNRFLRFMVRTTLRPLIFLAKKARGDKLYITHNG